MELTLRDYVTVFLKRKWLVSLIFGVCLGGAAAATFVMTPIYEAQTQLFVGQRQTSQIDIQRGLQDNQNSAQLLKSYAQIATTRPIAELAIQQHHLPLEPSGLSASLTAEPILDTQILRLSLRSADPALAQAAVNAVAKAFVDDIQKVDAPVQGDKTPANRVSVIEPAGMPSTPVSPDPIKNFGLAGVFAVVLSVGAVFLTEQFDTTINHRSDVYNADIKILAEVPKAKAKGAAIGNEGGPVGEAFRRLRASIRFIDNSESVRSMLVSSALPAEGKSTVAINLAIVYAQTRMSTVLLEADLRNPVLHKIFNFDGASGLTEVLSQGFPLQRAILRTQVDNLSIVPAGSIPHDPSELLGSEEMIHVLNELRSIYQIVIVDSAPLLPVADSLALASRVDGTIVVAHGRRTKRAQLNEAVDGVKQVGGNVLGVVLNSVRPEPRSAYKYAGYYQYVKR